MIKKIYLAGPDVFRENAVEHLQGLKDLCTKYGFEGLSPFDNDGGNSREIFFANCKLIDKCDIVVANLNCFRGPGVDDGTAFEIGYAYGDDKQIWGYTEMYDFSLKKVTSLYEPDTIYPVVEDFGLSRNLMICRAITESGGDIYDTFENVLKAIDTYG